MLSTIDIEVLLRDTVSDSGRYQVGGFISNFSPDPNFFVRVIGFVRTAFYNSKHSQIHIL